jgi:GT2 family glycosyltransferase
VSSDFPVVAPDPPRELAPRARRPAFSVVVAAYQAAGTLAEALESALAQTLPAAEIVVVDDGSTDGTAEAAAAFGPQVTLLRKQNGGEGSAKNAGARAASGDLVVFLDADDLFEPERLEALAELAVARPDLDVITTDAWLEVGGRRVRRCYDETWTFPAAAQRTEILRRNFVFGLAAVSRERLLASGGFDESLRHATDWDLWCRLILDGASVGLVAEPLATYRIGTESLSAQRPQLVRGRCRVLTKALARDDLSADERAVAEETLDRETREAVVLEAHEALLHGAPDVRARVRALATAPGIEAPTRARAALAWLAPSLAARLLARSRGALPAQAGLSAADLATARASGRAPGRTRRRPS